VEEAPLWRATSRSGRQPRPAAISSIGLATFFAVVQLCRVTERAPLDDRPPVAVAPVSSPASATSTGSVRLRLKPVNAQVAVFLRAAGARWFAFNWALAQISGEP
jgi:hypothetical protein